MKHRAMIAVFIVSLFFSPIVFQVVSASDLTRGEEVLEEITVSNPMPELFDQLLDLGDNSTDDYNNFNYSEMDGQFGRVGKYVFPLSPPMEFNCPENQTSFTYGTIFNINEKIFSGASEVWFRLPFMAYYPSLPKLSAGNFTLKLYRLTSSYYNISDVTDNGLEFNKEPAMVWNRSYVGNYTDGYYFKEQIATTPDGRQITFYWLRVNAPLTDYCRYAFYLYFEPSFISDIMIRFYITEGDSFGDGIYNSWLNLSTNDTHYLPFDVDLTMLVTDVLHNGLCSVNVTDNRVYRTYLTGYNDIIGSSTRLNVIFPLVVEDANLTVDIRVRYSGGGFEDFLESTGYINGSGYVQLCLNPSSHGSIAKNISLALYNNSCNFFLVFTVGHQRGFDAIESGDFSSYLTSGGDWGILQSSMPLYTYANFDSFEINNTQFTPVLVPYLSSDNLSQDIDTIGKMNIRILARIDANNYMETQSMILEEKLKLLFGFFMLPIKAIDLMLEALDNWVITPFLNWLKDDPGGTGVVKAAWDFMTWLADGVSYAVGLFMKIIEAAIEWGSWALYHLSKFFGLMMGVMICILSINAVDAFVRGIIKKDPIKELSLEWERTSRVLIFLFTVLSFLAHIILGVADMLIPL